MRARPGMTTALGLIALLGCGKGPDDSGSGAPRAIVRRLEAVVESRAPEVLAAGLLHGYGGYEIGVPTEGEARADLRIWFWQPGEGQEPAVLLDVVAAHAPGPGAIGERYLDETDLTALAAFIESPDGEEKAAAGVQVLELLMDLATGVTYAQIRLEFEEPMSEAGREVIELDVKGFISVVCRTSPSGPVASLEQRGSYATDPPACTRLFDAIRAVPDDPDAPPPPWNPNPDDTIDEGAGVIPLFD